ncbi:hypothetical protein M422DRAFT_44208 [Sphaerobolus stellatus SS14]|nr:hypothetical protein M422DRAFT_44208 [Sphaerobolus stellatus SS14]
MAAAIRNKASNPPRKSPALQDSSAPSPPSQPRRPPAWRGNSNPPPAVYAPPSSSRLTHQPQAQSPIHGSPQSNAQHNAAPDTPLPPPSLIGTSLVVSTRSGQRYQGTLAAVPAAADADASIQLKDVRDLSNTTAPVKESVTLPAGSLAHWDGAHKAQTNGVLSNGAGEFRTDTDISQTSRGGRERELQAWQPDPTAPLLPLGPRGDEATFGAASNGGWDQFAANERMFGVRTSFDEDLYTTKLDRSGPDFKERERKAQAIANEIMGQVSSNPHIAEERGLKIDDSGIDEEDKYAGVVRGPNAYVPPARRSQQAQQTQSATTSPPPGQPSTQETPNALATDVPSTSVTSPSGTTAPGTAATGAAGVNSPSFLSSTPTLLHHNPRNYSLMLTVLSPSSPQDLIPTFRDFVTNEKQRLTQKRQALAKNEMDKRMSDLIKFAQSFKLNKPMPEDLVPILAKDEAKQQEIRDKTKRDAESVVARAIGTGPTSIRSGKPIVAAPAPKAAAGATTNTVINTTTGAVPVPIITTTTTQAQGPPVVAKKIPMVIQKIPPFNPNKFKSERKEARETKEREEREREKEREVKEAAEKEKKEKEKEAEAVKLNVNAPSFKLKPNAPSFRPVAPTASEAKPKAAEPTVAQPPNPFFGTRTPLKKGAAVHVKDDFNPFKASANGKLPEPASLAALWPFTGKRYATFFPSLPPQPPQPPLPAPLPVASPPVPPIMQSPAMGVAPPPYEEDQQQQQHPGHRMQQQQQQQHPAAAYGMIYAYPAYYPGQPQHMMPPGGPPPGGYIPGPFLSPMHYQMPPNGHPMYGPPPNMGGMPPQQYMQHPPPPGAYAPPPPGPPPSNNGRGSMPPTPMPPHAHAYAYHPSPQLSHAVPYPMMMPPPPNAPHNYENNGPPPPPPQMGGVGHV